ncbi:hypothetical protein K2X05_10485 [bacterium]|nr:hypothetical protein [bacterium]
MAVVKTKNNQSGQIILEASLSVSVMITLFSLSLILAYNILLTHWSDFWCYRSLICVIEEKNIYLCKKKLQDKLNIVINQKYYSIQEFWITKNQTKINLKIKIPLIYEKSIQKNIPLPLKSF